LFVSLRERGLLEHALRSKDFFLNLLGANDSPSRLCNRGTDRGGSRS